MKWNCYAYKSWSWGRYVSFWLWPALETKWLPGNGSLHFEGQWLFWEVHLNVFFKAPAPDTIKTEHFCPVSGESCVIDTMDLDRQQLVCRFCGLPAVIDL